MRHLPFVKDASWQASDVRDDYDRRGEGESVFAESNDKIWDAKCLDQAGADLKANESSTDDGRRRGGSLDRLTFAFCSL